MHWNVLPVNDFFRQIIKWIIKLINKTLIISNHKPVNFVWWRYHFVRGLIIQSIVHKILFLGTNITLFHCFLILCHKTSCLKLYLQVIRQVTGNSKGEKYKEKQKKSRSDGPFLQESPQDSGQQNSSVKALCMKQGFFKTGLWQSWKLVCKSILATCVFSLKKKQLKYPELKWKRPCSTAEFGKERSVPQTPLRYSNFVFVFFAEHHRRWKCICQCGAQERGRRGGGLCFL